MYLDLSNFPHPVANSQCSPGALPGAQCRQNERNYAVFGTRWAPFWGTLCVYFVSIGALIPSTKPVQNDRNLYREMVRGFISWPVRAGVSRSPQRASGVHGKSAESAKKLAQWVVVRNQSFHHSEEMPGVSSGLGYSLERFCSLW